MSDYWVDSEGKYVGYHTLQQDLFHVKVSSPPPYPKFTYNFETSAWEPSDDAYKIAEDEIDEAANQKLHSVITAWNAINITLIGVALEAILYATRKSLESVSADVSRFPTDDKLYLLGSLIGTVKATPEYGIPAATDLESAAQHTLASQILMGLQASSINRSRLDFKAQVNEAKTIEALLAVLAAAK